jgi:hypothetical protein
MEELRIAATRSTKLPNRSIMNDAEFFDSRILPIRHGVPYTNP